MESNVSLAFSEAGLSTSPLYSIHLSSEDLYVIGVIKSCDSNCLLERLYSTPYAFARSGGIGLIHLFVTNSGYDYSSKFFSNLTERSVLIVYLRDLGFREVNTFFFLMFLPFHGENRSHQTGLSLSSYNDIASTTYTALGVC